MKIPKWMRAKSKTENVIAVIVLILGILIAIAIPLRTIFINMDEHTEDYGFTVFEKI